jgi:hypothetical protein
MSAYVVDRKHIWFLVDSATHPAIAKGWCGPLSWVWSIDRESGTYERASLAAADYRRASEVGQMLWSENVASVRHRYPDCGDGELPGPIGCNYVYGDHERLPYRACPEPVAVLKACDGYEYQACEHPGWEGSEAHAYIEALRTRAIRALPGYEEAAWEVAA